jgi:hypothetical protein
LEIGICYLPFDWAQGGEPVEPFEIWCLRFGIFSALVPFSIKLAALQASGCAER